MRFAILSGALASIAVAMLLAVRTDAQSATPIPSSATTTLVATGTPAATPTAFFADTIVLRVINHLNGDGQAQSDEPGLPDWRILSGCSDVIHPLTTDANGYAFEPLPSIYSGAGMQCFQVIRPFGWLPTSGAERHVPASPSTADPFLMHDLGRTVMELHGDVISGGLPAEQGVPNVAAPFEKCAHSFFEAVGVPETLARVIVSGNDTISGCPVAGDVVVPVIMGRAAGAPITFVPGASAETSFVDSGDSMRFENYGEPITTGWIFDVASGTLARNCVVARDRRSQAGGQRIFVLADQTRPGCGAPGRQVLFFSGDQRLAPTLDWRPGNIESPSFSPESRIDTPIIPPETGSAGLLPAPG